MKGKVALVTGATSGIGLVTARGLAQMGATVIVHGRNRRKAEWAVEDIKADSDNDRVTFMLADFASLGEVEYLATIMGIHKKVDVLVNNAGGFFLNRRTSHEGYEMTFAVNHLAHFLLTARLIEALKAAAPARIINVSSAAHHGGLLRFDDLMFKKRLYWGMGAYGQSKLANILFTYELARRLAGTGITANTVHPGLVSTNFATGNLPGILRPFSRLVMGMGITPEEGAQTSILLASEPELEEVTGKYFYQMREARSSRASHDEAAARRLWEISEELTRVTFPIS